MADNPENKADEAAEKAYSDAASGVKPQAEPPAAKAPEAAQAEKKVSAEPATSKAPAKATPASKAKPSSKAQASSKAKPKPSVKKPARKTAAKRKAASGSAAQKSKTNTSEPTIDELKDKIMANTKNTTTDFTKNVQDAGNEMQARMKSAYEKSSEMTGEMNEVAKGNVEAFVESGKIMAEGMQSISRDAAEDTRVAFDTLTADLKKMAAIKSPTELFQLQGEIARRNFDTMFGYSSKNTEAMLKLANEALAPISNRMSVAAEKISKAA